MEPTQKQFWAGFSFQQEALSRQGSGFGSSSGPGSDSDSGSISGSGSGVGVASIHPSDETASDPDFPVRPEMETPEAMVELDVPEDGLHCGIVSG